jgi:hypothetical protein
LSASASSTLSATGKRDEDAILALIEANPAATNSSLATAMGWKLHGGEPNKMKAHRCVGSLKAAKLIKETRVGRYKLTPVGKKVLAGEKEE